MRDSYIRESIVGVTKARTEHRQAVDQTCRDRVLVQEATSKLVGERDPARLSALREAVEVAKRDLEIRERDLEKLATVVDIEFKGEMQKIQDRMVTFKELQTCCGIETCREAVFNESGVRLIQGAQDSESRIQIEN